MVGRLAHRAALFGALMATLLLVCDRTPAVAQESVEAYRGGIRAILAENWSEAATLMKRASDLKPDTGDPVRIDNNRTEPYLPFYYLGLSLYRTGDFSGAISAFNRAEQYGGVKKGGNYVRLLTEMRQDSEKKLQSMTVRSAPDGTRAPVGTVPMPTSRVPPPSPAGARRGSPPPAAAAMPTPAAPPPAPAPPPATAPPPNAALTNAISAAEQAVQRAAREQETIEKMTDFEALRQIDANGFGRATTAARADLADANAKLDSGRRGNVGDAQQAESLARRAQGQYEEASRQATNAVNRITGELVAATTPFFSGQYASARAALDQLNYPASRFAAQVRLFRAAAAYGMFIVGGQRDDGLRREAEGHVREVRRLQSSLSPDARVFSPRFVQFFASTR